MHKRLFGLLASATIAFAACSGTATPTPGATATPAPPTATPVPTPSPTAPVDLSKTDYFSKITTPTKTGGTLVMSEWQTFVTLNVYYAQANADVEALAPAFDGLLTVAYDLGYIPDMASNVPTVANGDVKVVGAGMDVTWKLKKGMLWSDGQPITCNDVDATWKWIMDKANTGLAGGTIGYEDISSIDGGTGTDCVMHFKKTYSAYLLMFGTVFPKHYLDTVPVADAQTKLYPLGNVKSGVYSGPYIPVDIKTGAQITYAPNANWKTIGYGADTTKNHAPYLDKLVFSYFADDSPGMIAAYRNGSIDVAMNLADSDIDGVKDIPAEQKIIQNSTFTESNYYNNKSFKAKFGDDYKTIIRAIMQATDVNAVMAGPMGGSVTRSCNNIAPKGTFFYKEETCPTIDPAAAAASLDAAGWVKGSDGFRAKNGVRLAVDYCTTTRPYRIDSITLVSAELKQIGIDASVNVRPAQPDVFGAWDKVPPDTKCNGIHGNYDVLMHGYISSTDPTSGYNVYTTKGIPDDPPHNGQNETRISIPAMDAAFETVNSSLDPAEIVKAMGVIQDIYGSDQNTFELPFFNHQNVWLVSTKVHNFTGNPTNATGNWNAGDWWVDQ